MMGSVKGRRVVSWRSPPRLLMKAIAVRLHDGGLRGDALAREFERIVPHWREWFDEAPSDDAIGQRADKARRYPREFDAIRPYMPAAKQIVLDGRVGKRDMRRLAAAA